MIRLATDESSSVRDVAVEAITQRDADWINLTEINRIVAMLIAKAQHRSEHFRISSVLLLGSIASTAGAGETPDASSDSGGSNE